MIFEDDNLSQNGVIKKAINNVDTLWVEKYRPKNLDDVIIPERVRTDIKYFLDNGLTRNLLMYGSTGTGKTTIARILCVGKKTLSINASEENGIDMIRERIVPFSTITSMNGGTKVCFLDEIDNLSSSAMLAFRGVIESGAKTVRYIGTCNYPERLNVAIKSRFGKKINFDFKGDELTEVMIQKVKRIKYICEKEGLQIENDALKLLISKMTDMRDVIENLQSMYERGLTKVTLKDIESNLEKKFDKFFDLVLKPKLDIFQARNFIVANYPNLYFNLIIALGDEFCMWVKENRPSFLKNVPYTYVISHKYKNESMNKPDLLTSLLAFIIEIQHYVNKT